MRKVIKNTKGNVIGTIENESSYGGDTTPPDDLGLFFFAFLMAPIGGLIIWFGAYLIFYVVVATSLDLGAGELRARENDAVVTISCICGYLASAYIFQAFWRDALAASDGFRRGVFIFFVSLAVLVYLSVAIINFPSVAASGRVLYRIFSGEEAERARALRQEMLAEAPTLIIGTWRDENSTFTYRRDGTTSYKMDEGDTGKERWSIDGDTLTRHGFEHNGRPTKSTHQSQILEITSSKMVTRTLPNGRRWHASRVK